MVEKGYEACADYIHQFNTGKLPPAPGTTHSVSVHSLLNVSDDASVGLVFTGCDEETTLEGKILKKLSDLRETVRYHSLVSQGSIEAHENVVA